MHSKSEKKVFEEILSYNYEHLRTIFNIEIKDSCYIFTETQHKDHYVSIAKQKDEEAFFVPVNADFGFQRPAGSNNYPKLIEVGRCLAKAFNLSISW